jgi:amino-acid N-acetyltransferase
MNTTSTTSPIGLFQGVPSCYTIRRASQHDIPAMLRLINAYASNKIMLPRTESDLAGSIREFVVVYSAETLVGCGALYFYSVASAEVRSLAVDPASKGAGVGRMIVEALIDQARRSNIESVFAFTYVTGFFTKLGFERVQRQQFPQKILKDCIKCPKFQSCDEIPMVTRLRPALHQITVN